MRFIETGIKGAKAKVKTLMGDFGLSQYCDDIAQCDGEGLVETLGHFIADRQVIKARVRRKVARYRCALATQFDEMFPMTRGDVIRAERRQLGA
jgi:polysaccharide pyruvyl transferase WcaK-like protein